MVSVCIPVYKKIDYVKRLLESILKQSYKDIEVIISDDSPNDSLKNELEPYFAYLKIHYYHHKVSLGSPSNWNFAIEKSTGEYFMLIHQDDWLSDETAIAQFVYVLDNQKSIDFVYCRNTAIKENGEKIILQGMKSLLNKLHIYPYRLIISDVIGPPSNVMLRSNIKNIVQYDNKYIWLVDVDYYIRLLQNNFKYVYLNNHLVSIGLHKDQTTEYCNQNRHIMFKENVWLAKKIEKYVFDDILVYDYFWRLLRNYNILNERDFENNNLVLSDVPGFLLKAYNFQILFPPGLIKIGFFSKLLMVFSFLFKRP